MLGLGRGNKIEGYVKDYVIFDIETTGISAIEDKIIELSAVKVKNHEIIEEFSSLVNPNCFIPEAASRVNGITDDMVKDAPKIEDVLKEFIDFIGDEILIGHNIHEFDMKFIHRDIEKYMGLFLGNDYIDTLPLARLVLSNLRRHRLVDLAEYYRISSEGAHRALNDCRMNLKVYEELGKAYEKMKNSIKNCPRCGSPLKEREGKFGKFRGCTAYPHCRYTENL